MSYDEAMDRYGVDKPDIRFGMELKDVSGVFERLLLQGFRGGDEGKGHHQGALCEGRKLFFAEGDRRAYPLCRDLRRKGFDVGKSGRRWMAISAPEIPYRGRDEGGGRAVWRRAEIDLLLFVADPPKVVHQALGNLRLHLGEKLGLIPKMYTGLSGSSISLFWNMTRRRNVLWLFIILLRPRRMRISPS